MGTWQTWRRLHLAGTATIATPPAGAIQKIRGTVDGRIRARRLTAAELKSRQHASLNRKDSVRIPGGVVSESVRAEELKRSIVLPCVERETGLEAQMTRRFFARPSLFSRDFW